MFVGEAVRLDSHSGTITATFRIEDQLKPGRARTVDVDTSEYSTACGYRFQTGRRYLVFGFRDQQGRLATSICSRTRRLESPDDEVEILRALARGTVEPRVYGKVEELVGGIAPLPLRDRLAAGDVEVLLSGNGRQLRSVTDQEGRFRFTGMPVGNYTVEVVPPPLYKAGGDYWEDPLGERPRAVPVTAGTNERSGSIELRLRVNGTISGQLFDSVGQRASKGVRASSRPGLVRPPLRSTSLLIQMNTGDMISLGCPRATTILGSILTPNLSAKIRFRSTCFAKDGSSCDNLLDLEKGQHIKNLDFRLPPAIPKHAVLGQVLLPDGRPAAKACVFSSSRAREDFDDKLRVTADASGRFRAECLVGRKYRISAQTTDSYAEGEWTIDPNMAPITIRLKRDKP